MSANRTHREKASEIYKELQDGMDLMAACDSTSDRHKMLDRLRTKLSDYSYERYATGKEEANG